MKLKINGEFSRRHLFVTVLMAGLGCWFAYDGYVTYPQTPAAKLYETIEGAPAREGFDLEAFKAQKIQTQKGFALLAFLASLAVGAHLLQVFRFDFEFDDDGFTYRGKRFAYGDVTEVDRALWEKKGIIKVNGIKLDAWHHTGVKEFEKKLA
jgi:hypothetical protein